MTTEGWRVLVALIVALGGGGGLAGYYLAKAQRRNLDAQTVKAEAEARKTNVEADNTMVELAMSFGARMEARFKKAEQEIMALREDYNVALRDVREASNNHANCENELAKMRKRVRALEVEQEIRLARERNIDKLVWPDDTKL